MVMIMQFAVILFPGIAAALTLKLLSKEKRGTYEWVSQVTGFGLAVFWIMNGVEYLRGWYEFNWTEFTPQFLVKYCGLSLFLAVILAALLFGIGKKTWRNHGI